MRKQRVGDVKWLLKATQVRAQSHPMLVLCDTASLLDEAWSAPDMEGEGLRQLQSLPSLKTVHRVNTRP